MMFFEMPHFARELKHSIEKFNKIIHNNISSKKSEKYNQVKQMIEKSLREKEPFNIRIPQEARLGIAVLSFEPGMIGRVVQSNRLLDFLETALGASIGASNRLTKSLLELYYHRYSVFENNISNKMYMTELLKKLIREYHGRNPMVIKAKQISSILDGKLNELLALYKDSDINEIKQDLYLNEEDEFYERLRLTKLLEGVRKLELGENNPSLFEQIYENRGISATETRNIGEESVSILLDKCKSANATISTEWIDFILKAVGDPRSPQTTYAWNRIGDELKNWMIGALSQGDLIEFLGVITDGQGDSIYRYRKAFWMQYVKYVRFAKIMISTNGYSLLYRTNQALYERFVKNPTTYTKIDDGERSCIYMDFGSFKVIEGSHNVTARFYSDCPIDITARNYIYTNFYSPPQVSSLIIKEIIHSGSEGYSWQERMRNFMNKKLGINVSLSDILLAEDSHNVFLIENTLARKKIR